MFLAPYRVLDLTDERGELASYLLAQLGAEVIAIEPPEGSRSRHLPPFAAGRDHPEAGLRHWAYGRGKRSVVLDLHGSEADRETLRRLAAGADVLVESAGAGVLDALGLGYADLEKVNPALVYTSVTAFGRTGPKAGWAATDLTVWAAAGALVQTGDADRPPLRIGVPQAFAHASLEAGAAAIAALVERSRSGRGQHVDVSAQQAAAQATQSWIIASANGAGTLERVSGGGRAGGVTRRYVWPCKDGHVSITFIFGSVLGPASARFIRWMYDEGYCDESIRDKDWVGYEELLRSGAEPASEYQRVADAMGTFFLSKTKSELLEAAQARKLLIAPILLGDDVLALPQLAERSYWHDVEGVRFPGAFGRPTQPLPVLGAPPALGADTDAVLAEPGRSPAAPPPKPLGERACTAAALEGLRVLDISWVIAGPNVTRVLGDLGATVVRVESSKRIDTCRTLAPFGGDVAGIDRSLLFANVNAGKLGITLDPTTAAGRDVFLDLVRWADVVVESFTPKTLRSWQLAYDDLRTVNPRLIMLSSCLFGQSGPLADFAGYGTMAAALTGFFGVTGWPDRTPAGPFAAYTDYVAPRFAIALLLGALDHRRRTGEGTYIDFSQAEAALHVITPALLCCAVNGTSWGTNGNADFSLHPHGVYSSQGDDEWVALACETDAHRSALAAVVGGPPDDATIAAWTAARPPAVAAAELQAAGVPAHGVQRSADCTRDEQLLDRGHFVELAHPAMGSVTIESARFRLSRTPPVVRSAAPSLGQHTFEVLSAVLGYDDERIAELLAIAALE